MALWDQIVKEPSNRQSSSGRAASASSVPSSDPVGPRPAPPAAPAVPVATIHLPNLYSLTQEKMQASVQGAHGGAPAALISTCEVVEDFIRQEQATLAAIETRIKALPQPFADPVQAAESLRQVTSFMFGVLRCQTQMAEATQILQPMMMASYTASNIEHEVANTNANYFQDLKYDEKLNEDTNNLALEYVYPTQEQQLLAIAARVIAPEHVLGSLKQLSDGKRIGDQRPALRNRFLFGMLRAFVMPEISSP
eukprot:TRINITY_DN5294_c0_g1_i2.p1 TRINITY_DN5294_c0_g1~~TRINITY_DN5294_c0_g1_i2.p1  ORF type:complete len:252 (+),score=59.07 TRINITY_DN5294_c0_g1_i2:1179-1934(+)